MRGFLRFLPEVCVIGILSASAAFGQTLGTIAGEVRDATGAVVPGANLTVRNTETNVARTVTSNDDGIYSVPALNPGKYEVRAEKTGFKAANRTGIELQVQQTARIDFALDIGQVSETVEVSAAAPLLTTENATVGTVIQKEVITDLPLNGRNFLSLVQLSPNVTYGFTAPAQASGRQGGTRAGMTISLAGSRSTWSNYTLDGITNTDINFNLYIVLPSVEALQEFKVQTGIYQAEFGRGSGQINVSTKGGTNDYHGTAFEFLRNDKLDARPYFFKDPESPTQTAPAKQAFRQNQYGGTLAGPVQIPKLIDGKNRLFFMANFEGYKSRTSRVARTTVMTQAMRNGDFSIVPAALQDPLTRVRTGNVVTSSAFSGNQIPVNRINPGSKILLDQFRPLPNLVQTTLPNNNYEYNVKTPVDKDQFTGRIDFNENPNSQWFGRYSWTDELTTNPGVQLDGSILYTRASQWVLANTRVFSSSKVNEFRFGYNSLYNNISQELAGVTDVNGLIGTPLKITDPNSWGIPNITLNNAQGLSGFGNDANGPFTIDNKVYELTDSFSWVHGKHSFRFGGSWRFNNYLQLGNEFARARFTFDGSFTSAVTTAANGTNGFTGGYTGADFLLGNIFQADSAVALAKGDFRNHEWALYVDDTFKITPKLTINWGLRWETAQPLWDKAGNEVSFQFREAPNANGAQPNQALHPVYVRAGSGNFYDGIDFRFTGPVQLARDGRLGKRLVNTDYNNLAPRLGIAYSPSPKWSFRAGFGVFFSEESKNSIFDLNRGMGGRASPQADRIGIPTLTYQNFINSAQLPVSFAPGLTWSVANNLRTTYTMQYLLNIQRTIGQHSTLEVGYTGNQSRKLAMLINGNPSIPGITAFPTRATYPEWNAIQHITGDGIANYNAFSAKLTQRYGSDFQTIFSYTWSKAMDEISAIRGGLGFAPQNALCRSCEYAPADFNVPHRLTATILYSLPIGKGKRFMGNGGVLSQVVGGWRLASGIVAQSGGSINTGSWDSAGVALVPHGNRLSCNAGIDPVAENPNSDLYFVRSAFTNTLGGQYGNCARNSLIGPSRWNVDFSTMKDFRLTEKHTLQFRMEMFNAPNHPAWNSPSAGWGTTNATPAVGFGRIRGTQQLRQIQFALKYFF